MIVFNRCEMKRACRREGDAGTLFDLGLEPCHAAILNGIFEAGMFAIGTVAIIALRGERRFADGVDLVGGNEAEQIG